MRSPEAITYSYDGTNWDASASSATVTVVTQGLTSVGYSWSGAGSGTGSVRTISFVSNQAEGNIPGAQTTSVTVTGTKSDNSSFSQTLSASISVIKNGQDGDNGQPGGPGFFFLKRSLNLFADTYKFVPLSP